MNPDMTRSIESLELSVRAYNCLARAQLCTVKDIVEYDKPLINIRNLGKASLEEIVKKIESLSIPYKFNYGDNSRDPNYYRFIKAEE
jgi:DNA-directed RNA polymerase subunit alpha